MDTKRFASKIEDLADMLLWLREKLIQRGEAPVKIRRLELVFEEALVNVIHYAYLDSLGEIEVTLTCTPLRLTLQIRDWGRPFNPLTEAPQIDIEAPLEKREIGGLGIHLIRNIMDEVSYTREGETNVLTMDSLRER